MHKYTLCKKYKNICTFLYSNNDKHWYDHKDWDCQNIGMHSQGPCEISHLHNSLAFTEVRPRFYRNKTFRCLGQGKAATHTLRKLGYTELCVLNSCQKDFNMQWLITLLNLPGAAVTQGRTSLTTVASMHQFSSAIMSHWVWKGFAWGFFFWSAKMVPQ